MIKLGGEAVTTMVGGMVSEATGGKFQDGALTAMVIYLYNETASISISGSGGAGVGGTGEVGIVVAYDSDSKEPWYEPWKKISTALFTTSAVGAYSDVSISLEGNVAVSSNNHVDKLRGTSTTTGGSIDSGLPLSPSVGSELTISDDKNTKPILNLSAGVSIGVPENPLETHLYRSKTNIYHPIDYISNKITEYLK